MKSICVFIQLTAFYIALSTPQDEVVFQPDVDICKALGYPGTRCISINDCEYASRVVMEKRTEEYNKLKSMQCGSLTAGRVKVCCVEENATKDTILFPGPTTYADTPTDTKTETVTRTPSTTYSPTNSQTRTTKSLIIGGGKASEEQEREETLPFLPSRRVCGRVSDENRIYGGSITEIDEFPWLVRLKMESTTGRNITSYACSGTLISDRYVITASHCAVNFRFKVTEVRLGEWDTETFRDCTSEGYCNYPPVDIKVDKVMSYPNHRAKDLANGDIAILRLETPVKFTPFIEPICLPLTPYVANQDFFPGTTYMTAGWGVTELEEVSIIKRKLELKGTNPSICTVTYNLNATTENNIICAGGRKNQDTCKGDSGGPLMRTVSENYQNNWYLFGIVSYGYARCGIEGKPGLYVRLTKYMDWILETLRSDYGIANPVTDVPNFNNRFGDKHEDDANKCPTDPSIQMTINNLNKRITQLNNENIRLYNLMVRFQKQSFKLYHISQYTYP